MREEEYRTSQRDGKKLKELSPLSRALQDSLYATHKGRFYLMIPSEFYHMMTLPEVHVLAYLWNQRNVLEQRGTLGRGGWFYCTSNTLERDLAIPQQVQTRILKKLKERGYIKTERRGIPSKRHVRLVRKKITRDVLYTINRDRENTQRELDQFVEQQIESLGK